jgi:hypothetical protein
MSLGLLGPSGSSYMMAYSIKVKEPVSAMEVVDVDP